ncbi:unnamed protein product, partial [Ectocarpus sp. 12 AP-2014]
AWLLLRGKSLVNFMHACAFSLHTGGESNRTPNTQTCWPAGQNTGGVSGSDEQEKEEYAIATHVVLPSRTVPTQSTRHREGQRAPAHSTQQSLKGSPSAAFSPEASLRNPRHGRNQQAQG